MTFIRFDTTGSWTCPAGVTSVVVECWGGGRAGAATFSAGGASGRPGGSYARSTLSVTPGNTYTVTVGAQTAAGASAGNDSWFNTSTTIRAKGGSSASTDIGDTTHVGGVGGAAGTTAGSSGGSAAAEGGDGVAAQSGSGTTPGAARTGGPIGIGSSAGGNSGAGGASGANGGPGLVPGGGGGGPGLAATGGVGAAGRVTITYTSPAVSFTGSGTVTASGTTARTGSGSTSASGTMSASGKPGRVGNATITGPTSSTTANGTTARFGTSEFAATISFTESGIATITPIGDDGHSHSAGVLGRRAPRPRPPTPLPVVDYAPAHRSTVAPLTISVRQHVAVSFVTTPTMKSEPTPGIAVSAPTVTARIVVHDADTTARAAHSPESLALQIDLEDDELLALAAQLMTRGTP